MQLLFETMELIIHMKHYGLLAMSAKPYHKGHHAAVMKASQECDIVHLFVSLSDRIRPGEVPVYGADMEIVWKTQLEAIMPPNVIVDYVKVPVASVYEFAGAIDKSDEEAIVAIYADQEDLEKNFPSVKMSRYMPRLNDNNLILRMRTARLFSGTKMREFLASGDAESFKSMLPDGIDKEAVWMLLEAGAAKAVPVKAKISKRKPKLEFKRPSLKAIIFG